MGVEFNKRKGDYFDNLGEENFGSLEEKNFDNYLAYNKPDMDFVKVDNNLGTMMIFSGSCSPYKKQLTHLVFSFLINLRIRAKKQHIQSSNFKPSLIV